VCGVVVSKSIHQWQVYYSPRNGRVNIQACKVCGVAKGIVTSSYGCKPTAKKSSLLKGWSTENPAGKRVPSEAKRQAKKTKRTNSAA